MKTGKRLNILNKCTLLISMLIFSSLGSLAAESYLSGINIQQKTDGEYKVVLKVDKKSQIKKSIDNDGNLTLVMNSTLPSESMDIVYDNAVDLKNVIVQKKNDNNTLILLQADNIQNAQIYTKELATGLVKQLDNKTNIFGDLFFVADKKALTSSIVGMIFLFFMMLLSRPKEKRYTEANAKKYTNVKKHINANTLRNKNLVQSQYVPSINYKVNGSFNSLNHHISKPKDLNVNNHYQNYEDEEIRKVG